MTQQPPVPEFDPEGPDLVYVLVADHLQTRIERGDLKPGQRLPPERELADEYMVAYLTMRRATRELRERGLIRTTARERSSSAPTADAHSIHRRFISVEWRSWPWLRARSRNSFIERVMFLENSQHNGSLWGSRSRPQLARPENADRNTSVVRCLQSDPLLSYECRRNRPPAGAAHRPEPPWSLQWGVSMQPLV